MARHATQTLTEQNWHWWKQNLNKTMAEEPRVATAVRIGATADVHGSLPLMHKNNAKIMQPFPQTGSAHVKKVLVFPATAPGVDNASMEATSFTLVAALPLRPASASTSTTTPAGACAASIGRPSAVEQPRTIGARAMMMMMGREEPKRRKLSDYAGCEIGLCGSALQLPSLEPQLITRWWTRAASGERMVPRLRARPPSRDPRRERALHAPPGLTWAHVAGAASAQQGTRAYVTRPGACAARARARIVAVGAPPILPGLHAIGMIWRSICMLARFLPPKSPSRGCIG